MDITKEEFERYTDVQHSGVTNMFHITNVCALSGLSREKVLAIMDQYGELDKKYCSKKD